MAKKMSILHSVYPYACFAFNVGQMVIITASGRVMNAECFVRVRHLLLFDGTLCAIWVSYIHFLVGLFCVCPFVLLALIIQ